MHKQTTKNTKIQIRGDHRRKNPDKEGNAAPRSPPALAAPAVAGSPSNAKPKLPDNAAAHEVTDLT